MLEEIRNLYGTLLHETRTKWNRYVPFAELIMDRWTRGKLYGFGERSNIYDSAVVIGSVSVGHDCWIGPSAYLDGSGGLEIGNWVTIGAGTMIASHSSVNRDLSSGAEPLKYKPIKISDNVFIGPNCFIEMGVTIGKFSVVEPHTYLRKSVPENSIVMGNPGRIVGQVTHGKDGELRFAYNRRAIELIEGS